MLDHLDDLESDFSAFHHIHIDPDTGDFGELSSARFFRLAERVPAYAGVMQALIMAEMNEERDMAPTTNSSPASSAPQKSFSTQNGGHYEDGRPVGRGASSRPAAIPLTPEMVAGGALDGMYGDRETNQALGGLLEHKRAPALV